MQLIPPPHLPLCFKGDTEIVINVSAHHSRKCKGDLDTSNTMNKIVLSLHILPVLQIFNLYLGKRIDN